MELFSGIKKVSEGKFCVFVHSDSAGYCHKFWKPSNIGLIMVKCT